jgi:hypothetical protein
VPIGDSEMGSNSTTGKFLAYCFNTARSISASTCFGNVQEYELDFKIYVTLFKCLCL